jgi:hypothetical protein
MSMFGYEFLHKSHPNFRHTNTGVSVALAVLHSTLHEYTMVSTFGGVHLNVTKHRPNADADMQPVSVLDASSVGCP